MPGNRRLMQRQPSGWTTCRKKHSQPGDQSRSRSAGGSRELIPGNRCVPDAWITLAGVPAAVMVTTRDPIVPASISGGAWR